MNKMLDELIMLADILDVGGLKCEAAELDDIIKEGSTVRPVVQSFVESLTQKIRENEKISPEMSAEFIKEINDLAETGFRTLDEGDIESMNMQENIIPENIAGAVDSIKEVYKGLESSPDNADLLRELHKYIPGLANSVRSLDILINGSRPNDQALATKILDKLGDKFNEAKGILTDYHNRFGVSKEEIEKGIPLIIERAQMLGAKIQTTIREKRQLEELIVSPGQETTRSDDMQKIDGELGQIRIYVDSVRKHSTEILKSIDMLSVVEPEYVKQLKETFGEGWAILERAKDMELKL